MNDISDANNINKKLKSELFHVWKKARVMFDTIKDDSIVDDWVRKNVTEAYELIDEAMRYYEYEKIFPKQEDIEESDDNKNNFLSNEDKRYPVPAAQESGDQFITRCILDANMKKRYPIQGDRFSACMTIYNENKDNVSKDLHNNVSEKFHDPMEPSDPELPNPVKPILP